MKDTTFELNTSVARFKDLDQSWFEHYDAVYVGDPFCGNLIANLACDKNYLGQAIDLLKSHNKKVYLSTLAKPSTDHFEVIAEVVAYAVERGIDAVEVYEPGTLRYISKQWPSLNIHLNGFFNVFNYQSANILSEYNVVRILPTHELNFTEINELMAHTEMAIELQVYGKLPLGYAEGCILQKDYLHDALCTGMCYDQNYLRSSDGKSMLMGGRLPWSGKDSCLFAELPGLFFKGYRNFRIEGRLENAEYRKNVGQMYRKAFSEIGKDGQIQDFEAKLTSLKELSLNGLCNGYYYETGGIKFVNAPASG